VEPSWSVESKDGTRIAGYEFGGDGDVLLIAHATGLCGAMYRPLTDRLTNTYRVVAFDFRGHGDSSGAPDTDYGWERMAEDVTAVTQHLGDVPVHGFGHSMGGAALLMAERNEPSTFTSMYLFEPIVFSDDVSKSGQNVMSEAARRRRIEFASRADAVYRYAGRPPFDDVRAGFLASYVDNGFEERADGRVRLKCLPEVEATVFENGQQVDLGTVRSVETPVAVAVGQDEEGPNPARLGPPLATVLRHGRLLRYEHIGHFGPFQDPWTISRDLAAHIDAHSS
jgi:pimeloyl-ACP methyl ester carboxylesterase